MFDKINFIVLIVLIFSLGCEIKIPNIENTDIPEILIDYDENKNEIYVSVSLETFKNMNVPNLEMNIIRENDFTDLIGCIENDSIYDFSTSVELTESNCLYYQYPIYGCTDEEAINYDIYAEYENSTCIFEGGWRQFNFGKFDFETNSFPIYLISSTSFQWFQFEIKGFQISSIESINNDIPCEINGNIISFNNFNFIESGTYELIRVYLPNPSINYSIELNDQANNGDMIANNQIFHSIFSPANFMPGNFLINFDFLDNNGDEQKYFENIILNYNFIPKIINVDMPLEIMLDDSAWTSLEFFVTVFDANNNIDQIKYLINTSNLTNDYEPDFSEDIFLSDPSWVMEYSNYIDKNTFRYKTVIPLKPAIAEEPQDEGKTGQAFFQFNVFDSENKRNSIENIYQYEASIMLLKCGDQICSENFENQNTCPKDCGE
tara:strand:- start:1266 stop:2567 length:1302 start_codon:yes stop_codon:yes gene_type:complete